MSQTTNKQYPLLDKIEYPADLRKLPRNKLPDLCRQLREYLIESVASCGGHFAAGLGVIELTIALHYVFNTPDDRLIWDVGHQSYPHKILTGRKSKIASVRKRGGLAPFPKRSESDYDTFGVGHSSTSIGAATGMALAAQLRGERRKVIAVIGDGGLTAGMAYEALNHLGAIKTDVLVILNDNEMSISPNVGAMTNYLTRILSSKLYTSVVASGKRLLEPLPPIKEFAHRTQEHLKGMIIPGTLFEELGISYYGPIDGHNINTLVKTLTNLKRQTGPRLLHTVTRKGKGYERAENDPVGYHAVSHFDPGRGVEKKPALPKLSYSQVFSRWVCDTAAKDPRLVAITPAMREGSALVEFEQRFPNRYFDVGIAEQHAVTLAAGFACEGMKPVVAIYSTFLQRAYDQLIHDVAIQNLPVIFAIDRAGLVGPDGQTHSGSFDFCYLRCIPNMVVMAPRDENNTRLMLNTAFKCDAPAAVRYPRGTGPGTAVEVGFDTIGIGLAEKLREGRGVAILAFGSPTTAAIQAAERLDAGVVDMRFVKPLDQSAIIAAAGTYNCLVTVEDNAKNGGAGSGVNECLAERGLNIPILNLGLPDRFQNHGGRDELLDEAGLNASGIEKSIREWLESQTRERMG